MLTLHLIMILAILKVFKLLFDFQGHCFGGSGYFGVGAPQFFYASIDALTLGKIIRLMGFTFQIPPPIAQTGFPEGASVSVYAVPCWICLIANSLLSEK